MAHYGVKLEEANEILSTNKKGANAVHTCTCTRTCMYNVHVHVHAYLHVSVHTPVIVHKIKYYNIHIHVHVHVILHMCLHVHVHLYLFMYSVSKSGCISGFNIFSPYKQFSPIIGKTSKFLFYCIIIISLVLRPHPKKREKGLVTSGTKLGPVDDPRRNLRAPIRFKYT